MSLDIIERNEFGQVETTTFSDENKQTVTDGLTITHNLCQASISLYGGHVLTWQPKNQKPVFWVSNTSLYGNNKGIRGGIPICLPWFGAFEADQFKHTQNKNLSNTDKALITSHGFARTTLWELDSVEICADFVKVILIQKGNNKTPVWDIDYELKQELIFGASFSQSVTITNKSINAIEYTGALHSYFAVSKPVNTQIDKLPDTVYFNKLTSEYNTQIPLNNCEGPIDRVYDVNNKMKIIDNDWHRIIEVESLDCNQWVLWNPGKAVADNMADVHQGGENEYVCLEAANTKPVNIPAQSSVSFSQRISVHQL